MKRRLSVTFTKRDWQIVRHSQVRKFSREREISPRNAVCPSHAKRFLQIVHHLSRNAFCKLSVSFRETRPSLFADFFQPPRR